MFPATLLTTLILALSVAANPVLVNRSPVTLPISRRVNTSGTANLLRHDQNRAKVLKARGLAKANNTPFSEAPIVNQPIENEIVSYVAFVGIGSPPTTYSLLVDTGSSNTWVGAAQSYVKTSTSVQTTNSVSVTYGSGSFSGTEFTDTVTLASGLMAPGQSIGVASTSIGFEGVDGILGLGPADLTVGTLSPATTLTIPTIVDTLFRRGIIPADEIGISFVPTNSEDAVDGELTWGGTDSTKFTGSISFIPRTTTSPASEFWGINQSIRYGTSTAILSTTAGIVDTGTTLVLLATDGFNKYKTATGGVLDSATGLLRITDTQFSNLQSLFFTAGGTTFELTANAQIWPRSLNADIGGVAGRIYLIVADLGSPSGEGLDFVNGFTFLQRFYSLYDTTNNRVGLATTQFTKAISN